MKFPDLFARRRYRAVWSDPLRKYRTLESFAETEADGGKDLLVAARRVLDPDLRAHLERHAADEVRHANLFRKHADEVRSEASLEARETFEGDRAYDLARGRKDDVDAHGFFKAGMIDELGEASYIAMVNVAERNAAELFELHRDLVADDPGLAATFTSILKDEKYHVAYTERFLAKWRAEGRGKEVDDGLRAAKSSRFLGAWRRLGVRSGASFSKAVLYVFYWTLLVPFGLAAGGRAAATNVKTDERTLSPESFESQY